MPTPPVRHLALVGPLEGERRATHTAGYPLDPERMLPLADVLLLVVDAPGGGAMLFRYTAHAEFGGDTWHHSAAEARTQAAEEYGEALGDWVAVAPDVEDAHAFAVKYAYDRLDHRDGG